MKRKKPKTCECVECLMAEPCGAPATNAKDRVVALCTDCAGPRRTWAKYDTGSELDELWDITCAKRDRPKKPEGARTGPVLRVDVPMVVVVGHGGAARRVCDECWQRNPVGAFSVFDGLCTLPCETCGAHPRPCFCDQCRPETPRREWRPSW